MVRTVFDIQYTLYFTEPIHATYFLFHGFRPITSFNPQQDQQVITPLGITVYY